MNAPFTQEGRLGQLHTVLGKDVLVLQRFDGSDSVDELFQYQVEALSTEPSIDFDKLLGTHATIEFVTNQHGPRYFDGIVTQAQWTGVGDSGNTYKMELRPWLWVTGNRRNQRIFHNLTVVQILDKIFADWSKIGNEIVEKRLTKEYPTLEYTVQYRESDLAFACRLMERFGISYHFDHSAGNHCLVLTDNVDEFEHLPGKSREFKASEGQHHQEEEHFWEWSPSRNLVTGAMKLTDYNFKKPTAAMMTEKVGEAKYAEGKIESYDYPGDYLDEGTGKGVVRLRTTQERGQDHRHEAIGDAMSLSSGMLLSLVGQHTTTVRDTDYLCLTAIHSYKAEAYGTVQTIDDEAFSGRYIFTPADAPYAPALKTPTPLVHGPQTAKVVGEGEIDCDEFGRILVQFHWDLNGDYSMRCRVSQNWASKGWGGMVIPRIGMEVVVEFLEGDPDKPLVTGCVYNGKNTVPYPLPDNKTRSTFKTDTHEGDGFNELRFEDKAGAEEIFMHAQKDRNEKTLNNHSERIDNNWSQSVGHNKSIEVTNTHTEVIGGNMSISVGPAGIGQIVNSLQGKAAEGISDVAASLGIPGALNPGEGNMALTVEKAKTETVGTISATQIGIAHMLTVGASIDITSGKTMGVNVGQRATESVGKTKTIDVGDQLTITVGKSRIDMKKDGTITISGKDIFLKATGRIEGKAASTVKIKGSQIDMN